jgi:predicted SnoaL-like aldol condensation-catalyzing enzyme
MPAPHDLKTRSTEFLNIWCNEKDISKGKAYLHPSIIAYHDDNPAEEGTDALMEGWT